MLLFQFLILQVIVFAGVIFFLKKILYGDTQGAIDRLNQVYQDLLKRQQDLVQKIEVAEKEYAQKKEEAEAIKNKLTLEAVEESRKNKDAIVKAAKEEADEIVAKAHASTEKYCKDLEVKMAEKTLDFSAELVGAVLSQKRIESIHHDMVEEFIEGGKGLDLSGAGSHVDKIIVKSAFPILKEEKAKLEAFLSNKIGQTVKLEEAVDKELVAGIMLQFGTLLLDGTLRNALKESAFSKKQSLNEAK